VFWVDRNSAQSEAASIVGTVQDELGAPVANATVRLTAPDFEAVRQTQADGKFEFRALKPGKYRLTATAARLRKETLSITITRADESVTLPVIKLAASSLHVAVLDASNQPLGAVTVTLYFKERGVAPVVAERRVTDEAGSAFFGRLAQGSYQLTATMRGYDEYRNDVFISSGITTEFPLQLLVAPVIPINEKAVSRYGPPNLASKNVQCVFQDSEGWMWFGTDKGVTRFNGADFESSAVAGSGFEHLAGEDVRSMAEDQSGAIWLATAKGARRISKNGTELGPEFGGHDARHVLVDARGNVWVATADGLFKFEGNDFVSFTRSEGLPSDDVRATAEDRSGRKWIATAAGVVILDGSQLRPLETRDSPVGPGGSSSEAARTNAASTSDARSVFVDRRGAVWLATGQGVMVFDGDRAKAVSMPTTSAGVRAITEDHSGRMWFSLESGGALVYDPASGERQRLTALDRDRVSAIYSGREGHIWFGTDNGAVNADFYSFVDFTTSRGLADNDVLAVVEPPDRDQAGLWLLTSSGVSRAEGERFAPLEGFRGDVSVRAAAFDLAGSAWFATEQGALRLTGQTITQFNEGGGLASNNVRWVASTSGGAAVVFATSRGVSVFKDRQLKSIEALAGYDVRHVFEDWDGRLWFSTARGVVSLDAKSGETQSIDAAHGLADNDARWMTRFQDGLLIATRGGVQFYGGGTDFRTLDGTATSALFVDRDGFLWAGTDDGQVKKFVLFAGHTLNTIYSGEVHALTASRINSFAQDTRGQVWIATDKGAVRHIPLTAPPPAHISLEVDGQPNHPSESGAHQIPYGRHRLTFHFAGISMSGQVRYLYRINPESGDARWEVLPVQQGALRDVSVLDLNEGAHTFELVALNRDLYGSAAPAVRMVLRVGAPFWKRGWFYGILLAVAALAAGAVFAAHRFREREYVLPRELRSFVPIEPNPYIVGNPIRNERMFFGREDDFRYVRTKLEGASQGVVIVFCGDRRVGKSSILYQVLNGRLGERFVPVFVDLQEMVVASDAELFARMTRLIAEAVARANSRELAAEIVNSSALSEAVGDAAVAPSQASLTGGTRAIQPLVMPRFDGGNPYPVFLDFLDEALQALGDRTLLILMDEYELMEGKVDEGKLSPELFTFLAGLMDNKERLALIFTGSRRLEERDKKYWRELLRRSLFRKVGFLSEKDAVRLITEPVRGRVVYGRGVVDVISRLTAGQPFYAQMVCQNTVDYANQHEQNWVTLADLTHVVADIIDNPLPQMIYTWDALSDDEKIVLSLLAETLPDGVDYAEANQLRASVEAGDYPVNLSENTIRLTLEEMFRRELLDKDAGDGFRFKIDLFRLWIRRSHSIWQVVKEVRTL
jgi:ligand-binding sensor domain-containing protein